MSEFMKRHGKRRIEDVHKKSRNTHKVITPAGDLYCDFEQAREMNKLFGYQYIKL
ncbi:MAG: hypothetical protein ACOC2U_02020 [bacterium]